MSYLFGLFLDFLQGLAPVRGALMQLPVAVLHGHDEVLHHVTVLLAAQLRDLGRRVLQRRLPLAIAVHLTYQNLGSGRGGVLHVI